MGPLPLPPTPSASVLGRTACLGGLCARADRMLGRTVCSGGHRARADIVIGRTSCSGGRGAEGGHVGRGSHGHL